MSLAELKKTADQLPEIERLELANHLLRGLPEDQAIREAWLDISEQRLAKMQSGPGSAD